MNSEIALLYQSARWGFNVVPFMMKHPEHGVCLVEMNGDGIKVKSSVDDWEKYSTWEDLDSSQEEAK